MKLLLSLLTEALITWPCVLCYAGNHQVAAAIAFSLALFSHVLNHTIMRLQSALYDLEHPRPPLPTVPSSGHIIFIISVIIIFIIYYTKAARDNNS